MPPNADHSPLKVIVAEDKSQAELFVPKDLPRAFVTAPYCQQELRVAGVEITAEVERAIAQILANLPPAGSDGKFLVAHAAAPKAGVDGQVNWSVDPPRAPGDEVATASFYERSPYVMVKSGQLMGQIIPPTPGEDGRDVCGRPIRPRPGKPAALKLDASVLVDARGMILAQKDGVLVRSKYAAGVSQVLEADGVNFSTGNIDFDGDVVIKGGVRDRFVIKASGSVEVAGLIEAATIECGGDMIAKGGMAGRERGSATVAGEFTARYLDSIKARTGGNIRIEREVMNCQLTVGGGIDVSRGAIIGGTTVLTGPSVVGTLGSVAGVPTTVVLGTVPLEQVRADEARGVLQELVARINAMQADADRLKKKPQLTPQDKERQTEMMFELHGVMAELNAAKLAYDEAARLVSDRKTIDLTIERRLYPRVMLVAQGNRFEILKEIKGPLRIFLGPGSELYYELSTGAAAAVSKIARASSMAA